MRNRWSLITFILRIQIRLGLFTKDPRLLFGGLDFYRSFEYSELLQRLNNVRGKVILDIGSSDSIIPQVLAWQGAYVFAIDIDMKVKKQQKWGYS